jgi:hypothetical protein
MTEGTAELEKVGALAEMDRGEGVAEGVEARPGGIDIPHERLEDAAAEVVGIERAAAFIGEGKGGGVLVGLRAQVDAQLRHQRGR